MAPIPQPQASRPTHRAVRLAPLLLVFISVVLSCAPDPEQARIRATTRASYDKESGRLRELTYDQNKDGVVDTWTKMDGPKILSSDIDSDQDGKIDRWESYGEGGRLEKVALSRANNGVADMWLYPGSDGRAARAELSTGRDGKIDRWEWYQLDVIVRAEDDANGDGRADKWETYQSGRVVTASFDEDGDGRPDRRLTYAPDGSLVSIESEPDAGGAFMKKIDIGK